VVHTSGAERRPQRLEFELGPPFDIRYRQVALLQVFIQILLFPLLSNLPTMLYIHALLCIQITVKS